MFIVLSICVTLFVYAGIPLVYSEFLKFSLRRKAVKANAVVLTFDDGPGSRLTPIILKILAEHNVKATFFLLGRNISGRETIVRRIADEGHEICSHGYNHLNYWFVTPFRALRDIKRGWENIDKTLNKKRRHYPFRPPYGKLNIVSLLYLLARRVPIIYWSVVSGDTGSLSKLDSQRTGMLTEKAGGGIILYHDFDRSDDSIDGLIIESICSVLEFSKNTNMRFVTISELQN